MQSWLTFSFILFAGFLTVQAQVPGGNNPTTPDDEQTLEKAKEMVAATLKQQLTEESGYKTNLTLSDWKITKQVVSGLRYNLKWKNTHTYSCAEGANCAEKAPKIESCSASVWIKAGTQDLQYVNGKEPTCTEE